MGTFIVGAVVACVVGLAAHKVYKNRRSGKGCGGCREGCACRRSRPRADNP